MATESSAVVRFISLAQKAQNPVLPTAPAPITSEFGTEVLRTVKPARSSRAPLIVGAIALAGAAAAGGLYLGKSSSGGSSPEKPGAPAAAAAAPLAAVERSKETAPASAPVTAPPAAAATAEPQVTSPVVSVPPDVLAETGFDIRVEPGATISLDGSVLGKAPLRVRNLQAGAHVLDLEAPAGYFSRRMEVVLAAGEAKELKLSLDPIEEDPSVAAATTEKSSKRSRADVRRERKEKAREERARKNEMKATRVAAAKAAKSRKNDNRPEVVAQPLPEADAKPAAAKSDKQSDSDADLEAAMADIVGKPSKKKSAAAAAGASSLAAAPISGASKGTLMLGSKPLCDIIVDGKPTGLKTPQRAMELEPGTHQIVLVNADLGVEKKFKVRIAPGKTTKAIQNLSSKD